MWASNLGPVLQSAVITNTGCSTPNTKLSKTIIRNFHSGLVLARKGLVRAAVPPAFPSAPVDTISILSE